MKSFLIVFKSALPRRWCVTAMIMFAIFPSSAASLGASADGSKVTVLFVDCAGPKLPKLTWDGMSTRRYGVFASPKETHAQTYVASAILPAGDYRISAFGNCTRTASVLLLGGGYDRHITLAGVRPLWLGTHYGEVGGTISFAPQSVFARCQSDNGSIQVLTATVDGGAYYFDDMPAWQCAIAVVLWGYKGEIRLTDPFDLSGFRKHAGILRRDLSIDDIVRYVNSSPEPSATGTP